MAKEATTPDAVSWDNVRYAEIRNVPPKISRLKCDLALPGDARAQHTSNADTAHGTH
jgi:hypothetical protein